MITVLLLKKQAVEILFRLLKSFIDLTRWSCKPTESTEKYIRYMMYHDAFRHPKAQFVPFVISINRDYIIRYL